MLSCCLFQGHQCWFHDQDHSLHCGCWCLCILFGLRHSRHLCLSKMQDLMLANLEQFVTVKICFDFLVILNHLDAMEDLKPIFCSAAFRMNIKWSPLEHNGWEVKLFEHVYYHCLLLIFVVSVKNWHHIPLLCQKGNAESVKTVYHSSCWYDESWHPLNFADVFHLCWGLCQVN